MPPIEHELRPQYAPMMWPLAFPSGEPSKLVDGRYIDGLTDFSIGDTTLAMLMQPEKNEYGDYIVMPTP